MVGPEVSSFFARKRSSDAPRSSASTPTLPALLRLAGAVLVEAHDEWQVSAERRCLCETLHAPTDHEDRQEDHRGDQGSGQARTHDGMIRPTGPHGVENSTTQRDVTYP